MLMKRNKLIFTLTTLNMLCIGQEPGLQNDPSTYRFFEMRMVLKTGSYVRMVHLVFENQFFAVTSSFPVGNSNFHSHFFSDSSHSSEHFFVVKIIYLICEK